MAVHDAAYATRPSSYVELRWRLQHLAEERIGKAIRRAGSDEDEAADRLREALG